MDTRKIYSNLLKVNKKNISFSHYQFKNCLEKQVNKCDICHTNFNVFNGYPVVLGKAESLICKKCCNSLDLLDWDTSNLAKAITVINKLT